MTEVGRVVEIVRYPVKSMAGVAAESAELGWHGLAGDRRFAFRRLGDESGFPWVQASRLPELLLYAPIEFEASSGEPLPTRVRTPSGAQLGLRSAELRAELAARLGSDVDLMQFRQGIFDEGTVSVISLATIAGIAREAGFALDRRRFRANLVIDTQLDEPFCEDRWIGRRLRFGDSVSGPAVGVTLRDARCVMLNLDPQTAAKDARVMKAVVRLNQNNAGVYAAVVRSGLIRVGDRVYDEKGELNMGIEHERVCPVGLAGGLDNIWRRWFQNPDKILAPHLREGMTVLDVGCGPGFFTIPMARLVGKTGRVIAADLQDGMLEQVRRKLAGTECAGRVTLHRCEADRLGVAGPVDFALLFYMAHEVPDKVGLFTEIAQLLHPTGQALIVEPPLHVSRAAFARTLEIARAAGLEVLRGPKVPLSKTALLRRV